MNKEQYNNVIDYTLKHETTEDSLSTARAIFKNMGVALPNGDMKEVYETLKTDNYMGWKSCTMQEAQAAADKGTAAIGISENRIVVLSAADDEEPIAETASVMTLDENTSAFAVSDLQYYSYGARTANNNYYTLVNGWLRLYACPTASGNRRTVSIPNVPQYTGSDGVVYKFTNRKHWCTQQPTMGAYINSSAVSQITAVTGVAPVINIGSKGQLTDETGRYWIAVGPNVVNPNHGANQTPQPSEMYAKGVLDIVLRDNNGKSWYLPAVVGGTKAHTWTNGVIQTWKKFPNGVYASAKNYGLSGNEYNGTVAVEFIGPSHSTVYDLNNAGYEIEKIIFYEK